MNTPRTEIHDVLGIGFGPSNLALAIAVEEHNAAAPEGQRIRAAFLERQPQIGRASCRERVPPYV